ncbi:hypothetical protein H4J58_04045 [Colwellia sp. MB3u-70]|nr:hypothetical protein [Colwellia sp. MB3u-8]MBA6306290.1 hypothetical protein [Colwellia sp. MB3u-70]
MTIDAPKPNSKKVVINAVQNTTKKESGKLVDLNFKVPIEVKRAFKVLASEHDMTQKELLLKAIDIITKEMS